MVTAHLFGMITRNSKLSAVKLNASGSSAKTGNTWNGWANAGRKSAMVATWPPAHFGTMIIKTTLCKRPVTWNTRDFPQMLGRKSGP